MLERLTQMTAHVAGRKQDERDRHCKRRDGNGRRQRREQLAAAVRHHVTDDDQREARERYEREQALVAFFAPLRHEPAANTLKRGQ